MKKHNLLKILGIAFLIVAVLSWIIPLGAFEDGKLVSEGAFPVGLIDLFRLPVLTFPNFMSYGLYILMIGGLYGVLNKTGIYPKAVANIAKKWKGKEKVFLVWIIVVLALLSSLTGLSTLLFVLVPCLAAILLLMGYPKVLSLSATIGSILVGAIGSTYGFSGTGYVVNMLGLKINDYMLAKAILMVIVLVLFILFVLRKAKITKVIASKVEEKKDAKKDGKKETKSSKKEEKVITETKPVMDIPLYEEGLTSKKSSLPLVVIGIIFFIIAMVAMYNWYYSFGIAWFQEMHENVMGVTIGNYPIFENIIGGLTGFGNWGIYELIMWMFLFSIVIGWIYNVKISEYIEGFSKGAKEVLRVAFYAVLANIIFTTLVTLYDANIAQTIVGYFGTLSTKFNIIIVSLIAIVSPLFYNDLYYLLDGVSSTIGAYQATVLPIVGILMQSMFGLFMLFLPTSVLLVAGLSYFEVTYKEWFKYIWKYLIQIFVIILVIVGILAAIL